MMLGQRVTLAPQQDWAGRAWGECGKSRWRPSSEDGTFCFVGRMRQNQVAVSRGLGVSSWQRWMTLKIHGLSWRETKKKEKMSHSDDIRSEN